MNDPVINRVTTWARQFATVRLVLLVGSRARTDASLDDWSDYDITIFADDLAEVLAREQRWKSRFGAILLDLPEHGSLNGVRSPTRLVQYADGTKIDFGLYTTEQLDAVLASATLPDWLRTGYRALVDKDGRIVAMNRAAAVERVRPVLTEGAYHAIVTEFFWELLYIAKNLQRDEAWLAQYSWHVLRQQALLPILEWYARYFGNPRTVISPQGRHLSDWLPAPFAARVQRVFCGADPTEYWSKFWETVHLFRDVAIPLAARAGYAYPTAVDRRVMELLAQRGVPGPNR